MECFSESYHSQQAPRKSKPASNTFLREAPMIHQELQKSKGKTRPLSRLEAESGHLTQVWSTMTELMKTWMRLRQCRPASQSQELQISQWWAVNFRRDWNSLSSESARLQLLKLEEQRSRQSITWSAPQINCRVQGPHGETLSSRSQAYAKGHLPTRLPWRETIWICFYSQRR